jgi:hypothetical protein
MSEKESNQPFNNSQETYDSRLDRIGSIEKAQQGIVDHLNGHDLGTPRMDTFTDYVDWYVASRKEDRNDIEVSMIKETMRQRRNSVKGYATEEGLLDGIVDDYWFMVRDKSMRDRPGEDPHQKYVRVLKSTQDGTFEDPQQIYAKGLQEIKHQEIIKRQPS